MKLLDLHINGFGKFHDRSITFHDGLNIIYGKNEAGKSTLHTFIRCMLFGLERGRGRASKHDTYTKYEPWDNKAVYGGQLRLEQHGIIYRLERSFQKEHKSFVIVDETHGRQIEPNKAFMDQLLGGLTEVMYTNTISIGQLKSATDGGMVTELKNYIANMNTSGSMSLNITRATAHLKNKYRELDRQMVPEAARDYTTTLGEIRSLEKEISAPEFENQLPTYQTMRLQVRNLLTEKQEEREALLQKIASGKQALAGGQFTDEASIRSYQNDTERTYKEHQAAQASISKASRRVWMSLSLLAAAALTGISTLVLISGTAGPLFSGIRLSQLQILACSAGGALLTFMLGLYLWMKGAQLKKEVAMSSKILQEIFSRHLGDSSISEDAIKAFHSRMEEFIRLSQVLIRSEAALKEQEAEISTLQERENSCEDAISSQQKTQWELEKKLEHLTQLKDRAESMKNTLEENNRLREEMEAIQLALDTMTCLSSSIRDSFGLYLNKTASDLINSITGGIYNSMSVDENLNLYMNTKTKLVPLEQVSSGTMDQIYLALRLAAARLIQPEGEQMPLIFDDSFVLYDDERLRIAMKWLANAYENQIIIFTCHQREAQMMTANQVGYHLISM
ncbi:MAG: ATP-binding protein [Lachnospiraceae bacterium]